MVEKEGVYAPEPFEALDIELPEALQTQTHKETYKELIILWLKSFVSCPSKEFKNTFIGVFSDFGIQEFSQIQSLDGNYVHEILDQAITKLYQDNRAEYEKLRSDNSLSYIVFNGVSINFHKYFKKEKNVNIQEIEIPENSFKTEVENVLGVAIHGRDDVNNVQVLRTLELKISSSGGDFTQADAERTLQEAYTLAFEREMKGVMKKQTEYMRVNHDVWQEAFLQRLTEISNPDLQSLLLFLPFVESNLNPKAKSEAGAIGLWQITPATAKRNSGGFTLTTEDLYDPLVSTKVAARYLNTIISNLKAEFPNQSEKEIVFMALREYNGAWSARLKPEYRIDTFQAVVQVYIQLDVIEAIYEDPTVSEGEKYTQMMGFISNIETTYFDGHGLSDFIQENKYNSSQKLYEWSQDYMKKVVLQQLMYPYQVMGAYRAYQKIQNNL